MPNSLELNVSPALLHTFANHPFHVRKDMEMNELVDSIRESGVIVPLIVRSRPEGGCARSADTAGVKPAGSWVSRKCRSVCRS